MLEFLLFLIIELSIHLIVKKKKYNQHMKAKYAGMKNEDFRCEKCGILKCPECAAEYYKACIYLD